MTHLGIARSFQKLPLFDEPYLRMQAMNLEMVDEYLRYQEESLLAEYMEAERTPLPAAIFVSALSQLRIFGVYELLRTWRQRAGDVLRWIKVFRATPNKGRKALLAEKEREITKRSAALSRAEVFHWPAYE